MLRVHAYIQLTADRTVVFWFDYGSVSVHDVATVTPTLQACRGLCVEGGGV